MKTTKKGSGCAHRRRASAIIAAISLLCLLAFCFFPVSADAKEGRSTYEGKVLLVGGEPFGVRIQTRGIMIASLEEVETVNGRVCPARDAGLRAGDVIITINGKEASSAPELAEAVGGCGGSPVKLGIERPEGTKEILLDPVRTKSDGNYRAGIIVKDGTAGIGTLTYVDPESGAFAGLGHGICSSETGTLLPMKTGTVAQVTISGVVKGEKGAPGELHGILSRRDCGTLYSNTVCGVCGYCSGIWETSCQTMPVRAYVKTGDATVYCTVSDAGKRAYSAKILKIKGEDKDGKNFIIKITDPELLSITGGIVQGMSGSPIVQDGAIVGAITHVLVNDPTCGYGILVTNMLDALKAPKE